MQTSSGEITSSRLTIFSCKKKVLGVKKNHLNVRISGREYQEIPGDVDAKMRAKAKTNRSVIQLVHNHKIYIRLAEMYKFLQ
jgi:hypothetical protein